MTLPSESKGLKQAQRAARPPTSIEELAVSQGILPTDDIEAFAALWPADDDPEELDRFIREQRVGRRTAARAVTAQR